MTRGRIVGLPNFREWPSAISNGSMSGASDLYPAEWKQLIAVVSATPDGVICNDCGDRTLNPRPTRGRSLICPMCVKLGRPRIPQ